jgi:hypothetical protein
VNFTSHASKATMIPISKALIIEPLGAYNEEQIKTIGQQFQKKIAIDVPLQLRGKYDFETLIDIFDSWLIAAGFPYRHNKDVQTNRDTFIV